MITITRRLASQLRTVMRRAFGTFRHGSPVIGFIADKDGLTVRSVCGDVAVEYRMPGSRHTESLWLPFEVLAAVEGKKDQLVDLEATGDKQIAVRWQTGNVPQSVTYDAKQSPETADVLPTAFVENPPELLKALHEASEVTDPESVRYALACMQHCPDGTIKATDGRQLLIHSGFNFPWQTPMLVPRSKVFRSAELSCGEPVYVGRNADWFVLRSGPWSIHLRINKDGKYPDLTRQVSSPEAATARCQLSKDDAAFLAETLPQLPCDEEYNYPVTLDLNGSIAVRSKAADQPKPTELVLRNSQWTGTPIRINTNRVYLQRALKLGVQELCLYGDKVAMLGRAATSQYIWMPLSPDSAILPTDDSIRIESPQGEPAVPISQTPRKVPPMSEPTTNTNAKTTTNGQPRKTSSRKAALQDLAALIEQAEKLRTAAHDLMYQASGVVKGLKQHRRQSKAIQNTLASLKQLKTLGV